MNTNNNKIVISVFLFLASGHLYADSAPKQPPAQNQAHTYSSAIDHRIALERKTLENPFVITPHRPNYALLTYTDTINQAAVEEFGPELQNVEVKFQFSVKLQLARKIFNDNGYLYVAYTQKALWQMFNSRVSSPFRDTNHEPELFLTFLTRQPILGLTNRIISFGINHQSNGQSGTLSRSWIPRVTTIPISPIIWVMVKSSDCMNLTGIVWVLCYAIIYSAPIEAPYNWTGACH